MLDEELPKTAYDFARIGEQPWACLSHRERAVIYAPSHSFIKSRSRPLIHAIHPLTGTQGVGAVLVVIVSNPLVLAMSVPLVCLFLGLRQQYLTASREIKRLESVNR